MLLSLIAYKSFSESFLVFPILYFFNFICLKNKNKRKTMTYQRLQCLLFRPLFSLYPSIDREEIYPVMNLTDKNSATFI